MLAANAIGGEAIGEGVKAGAWLLTWANECDMVGVLAQPNRLGQAGATGDPPIADLPCNGALRVSTRQMTGRTGEFR
ncbi:MAG: hypothetical protein COZ06_21995 [Armatimonadetes bacterium CG_4_10_14_3_um_filter_66_18]|nr:hypothetical protein [Armatimonadota bacterium]OIP03864.1 MAG: hypothetical protein AUJ96_13990 [Armatimonadetes bacterium CG2_30_66_41]PIU87982.1 MAG: hypothetical protein COS65_32025 [Armatimonadetes bacterium CG06_land_8_20_14_3_00_66_21]PIW17383.1 MAG: hypothetical protein COW34_05055 [Armatimonadetes bacterium CG17_big_fil_post_rev_8_21_14_2_50_66_6]PIX39398.1 MAG: hypothetical protein COZ57_28295 [Armatimonadetes bacterium CG_4_8_14_3_um_filter_66_20]PIY43828.1 MAG: hypothetical prote